MAHLHMGTSQTRMAAHKPPQMIGEGRSDRQKAIRRKISRSQSSSLPVGTDRGRARKVL